MIALPTGQGIASCRNTRDYGRMARFAVAGYNRDGRWPHASTRAAVERRTDRPLRPSMDGSGMRRTRAVDFYAVDGCRQQPQILRRLTRHRSCQSGGMRIRTVGTVGHCVARGGGPSVPAINEVGGCDGHPSRQPDLLTLPEVHPFLPGCAANARRCRGLRLPHTRSYLVVRHFMSQPILRNFGLCVEIRTMSGCGSGEEQIAFALRHVEDGPAVRDACREMGVSGRTSSWRPKSFAGRGVAAVVG